MKNELPRGMGATVLTMFLSLVLRLAGLVYYTQLGTSTDLIIAATISIWKTGYQRIASMIVMRGWAFALFALFATAYFCFFPLVWDYCRKAKSPTSTGIGRPLLFPCRITNTTLSPKKRSTEYSTLLVGIPVGWSGVAGGLISVDFQMSGVKPWYAVDAIDYLLPGSSHLGLRGKLDEFLTSQGIETSRYPYAYLVTTTRSIDPGRSHLSFWYLYSAEKQLMAIIAEVRNGFDKGLLHILIRDDKNIEDVNRNPRITSSGSASQREPSRKDLREAPFVFRNDICSLVASDPLSPKMEGMKLIDNAFNLMPSERNPKAVAQIISTGEAVDPIQLSVKQRLSFTFRWRLFRIISFPWIAKEATTMLFGRGFAMWEHLLKEGTTEAERRLEVVFRNYLRYLVKQSPSPLSVRYVPASIPDVVDEVMLSSTAKGKPDTTEHLEFKVLTSAFYSRFVCYAHDFEAMFCELHENHTIWVSEPTLLPKLVLKKPPPPLSTASYLDYAYFTAIKNLRKLPEKIQRPLASRQVATTLSRGDIRGFRLSSMDGYVLTHEEDATRYLYRHLVLKLFIADRIAWGSMSIPSLIALCLRMLLAWIVILPR